MAFPILGPIVQFFPALGIAVFPIVTITLRNNLMQIFGVATSTVYLHIILGNYFLQISLVVDFRYNTPNIFIILYETLSKNHYSDNWKYTMFISIALPSRYTIIPGT